VIFEHLIIGKVTPIFIYKNSPNWSAPVLIKLN